ncbi:hypothetical protein K8O68_13100 [Salipaludibacillus sp. CUR1]|uniref:hypothetical protein n=1 Tax=Salipaludibacillus sp. CUR1 TaxID=2820003 RepID=UPI001E608D71|nr:hypothetical protein [Salipaludibacillus sp. CUR1]MCE7793358.1 hypothetical protein [Salipaludibacillus sp. CUR1]
MKVISRSKLAQEKIKCIQSGYSAFAETEEVSQKLKQELEALGIDYIEEKTHMGSWFIPKT